MITFSKINLLLAVHHFGSDGQLISKPVVFRCYALTTENGVEVLPSALCFSNEKSNYPRVSGWIKDTWINTADRVDLGEHNPPVPIQKKNGCNATRRGYFEPYG